MSNTYEYNNIMPFPTNIFEFTELPFLDCQNEEEKNTSINEQYSSTLKNEEKVFDNNILEEQKIIAFNIITKRSSENENNLIKTEKQKDSSGLYSFEDIKNLFLYNNNNSYKKILENFIKDSTIEQAEEDLKVIQRKRKRNTKNENKNENKKKYDPGRKLKSDISERKHNKMKDDNIVLKIKTKIFKEILNFLNNILNTNHEESNKKKLRELDYNLIRQMKRDTNLKLLNMTLKDIFSQEISSKIKTVKNNSNELFIKNIMNKKKYNEIIKFFFDLQLREWINLFTMKKNIKCFKNLSMESYNEINQKLPKVDILLNDILNKNKNNKEYLSYFIFYLYNFENYFLSKQSRRSKFENSK